MGAKVIGVASTEEKRAIARRAGAEIVIGYDNLRDRLKEASGGNGIDVAFDPVGGDAFDGLARSMAWGGRLLVIGFASGTIPKFPVNLALVKGFQRGRRVLGRLHREGAESLSPTTCAS